MTIRVNYETGELYDDGESDTLYFDDWGTGSDLDAGDSLGDTLYFDDWGTGSDLNVNSVLDTLTAANGGTPVSLNVLGQVLRGLGIDTSSGIANALGTASNAALGLGTTGILGALAALTSKPQESSATSTNTTGTTGTSTGTTNQTQNQVQTQKQDLPQWYMDLIQDAATNIPTSGYDQFQNDMLNLPNGRAIADYMNPYLENVMTPGLRMMGEDQAKQRQAEAAARVSKGGFGSARADLLAGQMQERQDRQRQEYIDSSLATGFSNATGLATNDLSRAFEDWKLLQSQGTGSLGAAGAEANILTTLKPPTTTTGTTTGVTAGTSTGGSTGTTTGTTNTSTVGADPSRLAQLAGLAGTLTGLAYPQGLPKT